VSETDAPHSPPVKVANEPAAVAPSLPVPPTVEPHLTLGTARWGMISFLFSEVAFFSTLIVTYLTYLGQNRVGPFPREVLSLGLVAGTTACLLSSSVTIHFAEKALHGGRGGQFQGLWLLTILLGAVFLAGTGYEWFDLIYKEHLTISRNLFGTTFYTLVGFHGLHVTMGLIALSIVFLLARRGAVTAHNSIAVEMVSWYWHFVDVVWIVVFLVVYVFGR
jgi:cytochrome c oxidase subunit 3/cytochrome o ubiquinol oxidase subunit 3